jgi:phosphomannomutase
LPTWFGSSGIRGSYEEITPFFSLNLGIAVGKSFQSSEPAYIASDIRFTSGLLKACFASGFSYSSGTIIDIGLCPTPVISYITSNNENSLGVMVTASHNPPSNNGFKFFLNGRECGEKFEAKVEKNLQILLNGEMSRKITHNSLKYVGTSKYDNSNVYIRKYINILNSKINITKLKIKLVLDCANNVPTLVSPDVFKRLGIDVVTINETLNPSFPGRPSEPSSANLSDLKKAVIEEGADIGVAHDGDGDRFAIIDEQGNFVNSTAIISLFCDHLDYSDLDRRSVVLTSDCTQQSTDIAEEKGAEVITSRIGRNRDFVNDQKVIFLAEPNKLIFPNLGKWIDGLFPVLKLLEISQSKRISGVLAAYDKRKILRKAFKIAKEERIRINRLLKNLPELWEHKITRVSFLDGVKLFLKDKSSVLIRFSGTEPKIKFYIESHSVKKNSEILSQLRTVFDLNTKGIDC